MATASRARSATLKPRSAGRASEKKRVSIASKKARAQKNSNRAHVHTPVEPDIASRLAELAHMVHVQSQQEEKDFLADDEDHPSDQTAQSSAAFNVHASSGTPRPEEGAGLWQQWFSGWSNTAKEQPALGGHATSFASLPSAPSSVGIASETLLALQQQYVAKLSELWTEFVEHPEKVSEPIADARFSDQAWQKNPMSSLIARAYLLNADFLQKMAGQVQSDDKTQKRVKFAVQQWVEAAAPSNFLALNPKAQQRALETKGESLKAGLDNLLKDVAKGKISQSDEAAFEVGRNVATTEGCVVYENDLMQLIQYAPLTKKVRVRPFLIVPPCINKYYVLDLQPENSFVRYCVSQGNTVFIVSWKNPHEAQSQCTWDDYVALGPIQALQVVCDITGADKANVLGFCVGGTLLTTALAVMAARGEHLAASLTLLTALLDFTDAGVLDMFIDETHVQMRERTIGNGGLMPGKDLANTFSSLRPNDLVWNYVVANYLEGRMPPAFDLLYWNGDSTNLPGPMYAWYLRNTYLENNLTVPNKLQVCGVPIDLGRVQVPAYVFAAHEDHIVPWKSAYASAHCLPGAGPKSVQFVMGASGHIAGTINPATKNKRSYWVSNKHQLPDGADTWLAGAQEQPGSWWMHWDKWLAQFSGGEVTAPKRFGNTQYQPIEPAPGRYVKERA